MRKLGEIAEIRTGYPFRGKIERAERGGCRLVQMGDVRAELGEVGNRLGHVEAPANWEKHVLNYADVLFVGRGTRNEAATFVGRTGDVIAAPHLFVLGGTQPIPGVSGLPDVVPESAGDAGADPGVTVGLGSAVHSDGGVCAITGPGAEHRDAEPCGGNQPALPAGAKSAGADQGTAPPPD